jgi:ubiquinol-cytochrome c reductase cytochrome c1 subunit
MATETSVKGLLAALLLAASASAPVLAAGGGATMYTFKPQTGNEGSLQRGARDFMNYCSGCHSLKYLRYNRLGRDLGIPEDLLKANLMFTSDKPGDHILSSMPKGSGDPSKPSQSEVWFGRAPPDLTLTARERGPDWVYSYLMTFYLDPMRPAGVNNLTLPGASMPHVLGDLQGWQVAHFVDKPQLNFWGKPEVDDKGQPIMVKHFEKFETVRPGTLSAKEYEGRVADLTNFMVYAAEPGRQRRIELGGMVLLFTALFGVLAYFLKVEYWKDVH